MESLLQDVRFGLRSLRKRSLFAVLAVGTLGLGIGATTAIFSVVDGVLLRPLPYEEPGELVSVWQAWPEWRNEPMLADGWDRIYLSYPGFERWKEKQTHFTDVAIHGSTFRNFSGQGDPTRLRVGIASSGLFRVLGVQPALGRAFLPAEDQEGAPRVAILSHSFWRERFGASPDVLGRTINLNQDPFTIVGVMPEGFQLGELAGGGGAEQKPIWIAVGNDGNTRSEGSHSYEAMGRLAHDATLEQATPEAASLIAAPDEETGHTVLLTPLEELTLDGLRAPLYLLLAASLVLLLIACGNVATLLMGEFAGRRHEMATRAALGAGRGRLIRQLLTESVLLGGMGGILGVGLAFWGTKALLGLAPSLPRLQEVEVNATVLLFAAGLGVLTGLLFGMVPAWETMRNGIGAKMTNRGSMGGRSGSVLQRTVIALELALTLVLLVSGALLARSLAELMSVDTGFRSEGLAMVRTYLPAYRYGSARERAVQAERMRAALAGVPGVLAASGTNALPFYNGANALSYGIEGQESPEELSPHASFRTVLPGFFETMGIEIIEGRSLLDTDALGETPAVVISETMARRHWPHASPIGAKILFGDTLEVVGVAADVVHEALDAEPLATMYVPAREVGTSMNFVVRTSAEADALFPALRQAVWSIDSQAPISRVATLSSLIADSTRSQRFRSFIISLFALFATVLAGAGVFGVTARSVAQRAREMGIRKAVGAGSGSLMRLALLGTLRAGLIGVGVGLLGAALTSRLLTRFLFQVDPWDPVVFCGAGGGLLLLSLAASLFPAIRAASVHPVEVLREDG